ncbi:MAG: hypothetical protein FWD71_18760 [Oscillospiraceae bacterium]|nr:hypothetical protein [Oscillospiraceae bacterium]
MKELFAKGRQLPENGSLTSLKNVIQIFINKVVIYPDKVYVLFNFCDKKNPPHYHTLSHNAGEDARKIKNLRFLDFSACSPNEADLFNSFNLQSKSSDYATVNAVRGKLSPELTGSINDLVAVKNSGGGACHSQYVYENPSEYRQYIEGNLLHYAICREILFSYERDTKRLQNILPHLSIDLLVGRKRNKF